MPSRRSPGSLVRLWAILLAAPLLAAVMAPALASDDEEEIRGAITVDLGGSTVTVAGQLLVVDGETRLEIDSDPATLADMAAYVTTHGGAFAEAEYRVVMGVKVAEEVEIEDRDDNDDGDLEVKGELTADAGNSTVTVGGVELLVDANTDIEAGGDHVSFPELIDYLASNPGIRGEAHYRLDGETRVAVKVETKGDRSDDGDDDDEDEEELVGVLSANAEARTLSIGDVIFQTASGTEFKLNRRHVTFAVFASYLANNPNSLGKVEYRLLNEQLVAREAKVLGSTATPGTNPEAEVTGVIQSLNTRSGALELLTGAQVTLNLKFDAGTEFEVDNANVTAAELAGLLAPGLEVRARVHYDPTTLRVRELSATIPVTQQQAQVSSANARTGAIVVRVPNPNRPGRFLSVRVQALKGGTVLRNGSVARLADIKRGQTVTVSTFTSRRRNIAPEIKIH